MPVFALFYWQAQRSVQIFKKAYDLVTGKQWGRDLRCRKGHKHYPDDMDLMIEFDMVIHFIISGNMNTHPPL